MDAKISENENNYRIVRQIIARHRSPVMSAPHSDGLVRHDINTISPLNLSAMVRSFLAIAGDSSNGTAPFCDELLQSIQFRSNPDIVIMLFDGNLVGEINTTKCTNKSFNNDGFNRVVKSVIRREQKSKYDSIWNDVRAEGESCSCQEGVIEHVLSIINREFLAKWKKVYEMAANHKERGLLQLELGWCSASRSREKERVGYANRCGDPMTELWLGIVGELALLKEDCMKVSIGHPPITERGKEIMEYCITQHCDGTHRRRQTEWDNLIDAACGSKKLNPEIYCESVVNDNKAE